MALFNSWRCPHARLELDLDDADFLRDNFIHCKVHGALFDIGTVLVKLSGIVRHEFLGTGVCVRPPSNCRGLKVAYFLRNVEVNDFNSLIPVAPSEHLCKRIRGKRLY